MPDRSKAGPWDRATSSQSVNELDYVVGRLQNIQQAGEGSNLPPRLTSGVRVVSPTEFQIIAKDDYEGVTIVTLSWVESAEMLAYKPSYRVRVLGVQGDLYVTTSGSPATIAIPLRNISSATLTFKLETRLANGMVAAEDTWPTTSTNFTPIYLKQRFVSINNYACDVNDRVIYADMAASAITVTLPDATTLPSGTWMMYFYIINGGLNLTIAGFNAAQTVDGAASIVINFAAPCKWLMCDGSVWRSFVPA